MLHTDVLKKKKKKTWWITCESFYKSAFQVDLSHVKFRDCY